MNFANFQVHIKVAHLRLYICHQAGHSSEELQEMKQKKQWKSKHYKLLLWRLIINDNKMRIKVFDCPKCARISGFGNSRLNQFISSSAMK